MFWNLDCWQLRRMIKNAFWRVSNDYFISGFRKRKLARKAKAREELNRQIQVSTRYRFFRAMSSLDRETANQQGKEGGNKAEKRAVGKVRRPVYSKWRRIWGGIRQWRADRCYQKDSKSEIRWGQDVRSFFIQKVDGDDIDFEDLQAQSAAALGLGLIFSSFFSILNKGNETPKKYKYKPLLRWSKSEAAKEKRFQ